MPPTTPSQFRLPEATQAKIAELAERWGGIEPAAKTAVVVRSIDLAHAAEFGEPAKAARAKPRSAKS